jgi:signal transduction histidine kinase
MSNADGGDLPEPDSTSTTAATKDEVAALLHELRDLLGVIVACSESAEREAEAREAAEGSLRDDVTDIREAALRASEIVARLRRRHAALVPCCALGMVLERARPKLAAIAGTIPIDIVDRAPEAMVAVAGRELERILVELVIRACSATTKPTRIDVEIVRRIGRGSGAELMRPAQLRIAVHDDGALLPEAGGERDPRLTTVRRLLARVEGELWVSSAPDRGNTISAFVPLAERAMSGP